MILMGMTNRTNILFPAAGKEEIPMSKVADNCLGAEILLLRPNGKGHCSCKKENANPVLVTRGGGGTQLTANIIAESLYPQCDVDGNQYLLPNSLIDYQVDGKAKSLAN